MRSDAVYVVSSGRNLVGHQAARWRKKNMAGKSRLETSITVAAWVTAVAALSVSMWQGCETRKHNRLSVMPRLNINRINTSDFYGVNITNPGLGPAEIQSIYLYVDGQEVAGGDRTGWPKVIEKLGLSESWVSYMWTEGKALYPKDSSKEIFGIAKANYNEERATTFNRAMERLGILVCYCSLYQDCASLNHGNVNVNRCQ
ncbi:MAG: hypothetical protein ICV68_01590 [Pyrinomonadaceae bacterium]|nr:hypothetical protein [Pyrinomonadaceae bacterium]